MIAPKKMFKRIFSRACYFVNLKMPLRQAGFRILMYHSIGPMEPYDRLGLAVSQENFKRQMQFIKDNGFKVFSLFELIEKISYGQEIPERSLAITFDDGYKGVLMHGAPILQEYGYTAAIFVTTDWIQGKGNEGLKSEYWKKWQFLNADDLKILEKNGFDVQPHSNNFDNIKDMDKEAAFRNIHDSKKFIEANLQKPARVFSYPSGGVSQDCISVLKKLGFKAAVCSVSGYNDKKTDLFMLRRTEITGGDNLADFKLKMFGYYDWITIF